MKTLPSFARIALGAALLSGASAWAQVLLSDRPVFSIVAVPGNLALALSVEFPTAVSVAHIDGTYNNAKEYLGYFDPKKCYAYNYSATEADRHFYPIAAVSPAATHACTSAWSGNFMNWATMQTIDPFRWALTGGYRVTDTAGTASVPSVTIIEKAWASGQGGTGNFPNRSLSSGMSTATPLTFGSINMRIQGLGNKLRFTETGNVSNAPTPYDPSVGLVSATVYEVSVRVKVCDATIPTLGVLGLEANCVGYVNASYKPEGLLQKYSDRIRYSAFGYLNDGSITRDGGVLRARQAYIGPTQPVPLLPSIPNPLPEWSDVTGVMLVNPRAADATTTNTDFAPDTSVVNSGVMNYLNKFGQITPGSYKTYDPVGELYYAATRYFKNLSNVPEWTNMTSASAAQKTTLIDGFPVITNWDDPILYSCQKNFILGIGDVNTHADKNVPGSTIAGGSNENTAPASLATDPVNASSRTDQVGTMQGLGGSLGSTNPYGGCCNNNSALMAGIAYDSNTKDIRPDNIAVPQTLGKQTIQTYWLDVLEYSTYKTNNQFYLAAKYGAFDVPVGFDSDTATALPSLSSWYTTTRISPTGGQQLPDSYFVASRPDEMVGGLTQAFETIAAAIAKTTTGVATSLPQVLSTGNATYSANYSPNDWTSEVIASTLVFSPTSPPATTLWKFSDVLGLQLNGPTGTSTGWDLDRRMVTWNGSAGIPFRHTNLTAAQKTALDTPWITGDDSTDFLNYLRGERTKESATPNYRVRTKLVHDIVGSRLTAVGRPAFPFTDSTNPGYKAFASTWQNRRTMLYVGTNGGVMHAINAAPYTATPVPAVPFAEVDANAGKEVFAYVPSAVFNGPSLPANPSDNGLAALGNPSYLHRNFVNASPRDFDIDLMKTKQGMSPTPGSCAASPLTATNWRTVLIGGLGKGGKSYYALDVTNPLNVTPPATTGPAMTEADWAAKVLWEFPRASDVTTYALDDKMGYSFGEPVVVKTAQHGWVVILASGYNNNDRKGYIFIVDACSGYLVQAPISTPGVAPTAPLETGLAHPSAFVLDYEDGTADAIYAGDLLGNLWRIDVRATTGAYPAPERIAVFKDTSIGAQPQPVTTRPMVELDPKTLRRFVMVGTGRLLDKTDTGDLQKQTFYAIHDGDNLVFDTALDSSNSRVRADLVDITNDLISGSSVFTTQKGWYIEVGAGDPNLGWRVINPSASFFGNILFVATLPDSTDVCAAGGSSLIYAVGFGGGKSILRNSLGAAVSNLKMPFITTDSRFYTDGNGSSKIVIGGSGGEIVFPDSSGLATPTLRRLNWREINIAE